MKKLMNQMKSRYNNLKIKYKLFLLVSWIMILSFLFTFFALNYVFKTYDEQLYSKSSQVLSTSSNSLESELKRIEDVSYNIITDPQLQEYLSLIKIGSKDYEKLQLRTKINDKLLSYVNKENYLLSISLMDANGEEYAVGPRLVKFSNEQKKYMVQTAHHFHGSNAWINPPRIDYRIATAREMREYRELTFDSLGTIVLSINMEKLVGSILEGSRKLDGEFFIADEKSILFPKESKHLHKHVAVYSKSGYQIKEIDEKKYFIVYMKSNYFNWGYVNVIPFNQIFSNIFLIKTVLIIIFIFMFLVVTVFGIKFTRNITIPIENLVASMKHVKLGDFKGAKQEAEKNFISQDDEVGKLQQNFQTMVQKIDELIHENYKKQLTIKETEFKALQAQINPHFLYNTLESINWLAKGNGQTQISSMVEALGYLLRNSISLKKPLVTIEEELNIVSNYILIQKYRFEERLDFHIDVHSELYNCYIPKLTIQPLVENAIHYALEPIMDACKISIYSILHPDSFELIVEDSGPGMDVNILEKLKRGEVKTRGQGVGLSNINERLKLTYGEEYGVTIQSIANEGTKVIIEVPFGSA